MDELPIIDSEATSDPIFLFQARVLVTFPEVLDNFNVEYDHDREDFVWMGEDGQREDITLAEARDRFGAEAVNVQWRTESVFLTREEGEAYGSGRAYNYPDGWRVYCVVARGSLCAGLKKLRKIDGLDDD